MVQLRLTGPLVVLLTSILPGVSAVAAVSFSAPTTYTVGVGPRGIATADLDGDGDADVAVCNANDGDISVLLGDGTGALGPATDYGGGNGPGIAIGDLNHDGLPDLVRSSEGAVVVLLGAGGGTFDPAASYAAPISTPKGLALGDFDDDGALDVAVVGRSTNNVAVLPGDGTGALGAATGYAVGSTPIGVVTGDFDRDGALDLAVANQFSQTVSVLLGNGDGTFGAKTDFVVGAPTDTPTSILAADLDHDGRLDLIVHKDYPNNTAVLLGNGDGTFGPVTNYAVRAGTDLPGMMVLGDFDRDGNLDLATASANDHYVAVALGDGAGGFAAPSTFAVDADPDAIAAADFDRDGQLDIVVSNDKNRFGSTVPSTISVLLNTTPFEPGSTVLDGFAGPTTYGVGVGPRGIAIGDFNDDARPDVAVANVSSSNVSILLDDGWCSLAAAASVPTGNGPGIAVGDLNHDGRADLVQSSQGSVIVALGAGGGTFDPAASYSAPISGPQGLALGDFDRDGALDVAVVGRSSNNVAVLLGDGAGGLGAATDYAVGSVPRGVATGDFDRDGALDLAVANQFSQTVSVFLGNGDGTFGAKTDFVVGAPTDTPSSILTEDVNEDGRLDLIVHKDYPNNTAVLLGNGDGTFGGATDYPIRAGTDLPGLMALGDFNRDGKPDLAAASANDHYASVALGNGTGGFGAPSTYGVSADPDAIAVADFNGDGKLDLVVSNDGNRFGDPTPSTVSVLLQRCASASISDQPDPQEVCEGGTAAFGVVAEGTCLGYRWRKDGVPLDEGGSYSGTATDTLTVSPATPAEAGDYDVVVSETCAAADTVSAAAALGVPSAPPDSPGDTLRLSRSATVDLDWTDCAGASSYDVLRCDASGGPCGPAPYATTVASEYADGDTPGTFYWYLVEAANACGATP